VLVNEIEQPAGIQPVRITTGDLDPERALEPTAGRIRSVRSHAGKSTGSRVVRQRGLAVRGRQSG
jgi:hypothetical protein